jgi:hypothetical protein
MNSRKELTLKILIQIIIDVAFMNILIIGVSRLYSIKKNYFY